MKILEDFGEPPNYKFLNEDWSKIFFKSQKSDNKWNDNKKIIKDRKKLQKSKGRFSEEGVS